MLEIDDHDPAVRGVVGGRHHHAVADHRLGRELRIDALRHDDKLDFAGRLRVRNVRDPEVVSAPAVGHAEHQPATVPGE